MSEMSDRISEHDASVTEFEARLAKHDASVTEFEFRLVNFEAALARILAHLDPAGTSKTLNEPR